MGHLIPKVDASNIVNGGERIIATELVRPTTGVEPEDDQKNRATARILLRTQSHATDRISL
jgi:hypothetical protein